MYSDMAKCFVEEGQDWVHITDLHETMSQRWHLRYHEPETELILMACSRSTCARDHLRVSTLKDALCAWPLPHSECSLPPCSCRPQRKYY
ncbi:hypothetical protein C5C00_01550 [Rathayibacter rathayi]|nr:hypothetical protein C5C47_00820 [Rathayibacter rathayi]PPG98734.1 hypothetical protein C5C00_01550 [Rathayibacter rathayi]